MLGLGHLLVLGFLIFLLRSRKIPKIGNSFREMARSFKRGLHGRDLNSGHRKEGTVLEPDEVLPPKK